MAIALRSSSAVTAAHRTSKCGSSRRASRTRVSRAAIARTRAQHALHVCALCTLTPARVLSQSYKSGVFDAPCGTALDHGVLVAGLTADAYLVRRRALVCQPLTIAPSRQVKNSWGESWGEKGYIRMKVRACVRACELRCVCFI